jgi:hypothetical protein
VVGDRRGLVTCEEGSKVLEGWTRLSIRGLVRSLFSMKKGDQ